MLHKPGTGHLSALFTIIVWGTTFISTKILLRAFTPVEILFFRFILGFAVLFLASPRRMKITHKKHEWLFAGAGLCGITLYYLLENIALTYSSAANIGIIISIAPFFTGLLAWRFLGSEKPKAQFFVGFLFAIAGIALISFNGNTRFSLSPTGDILAVLAAAVWAFYSILCKKIGALGYGIIPMTRRIFAYGILCMLPTLFFLDFKLDLSRFALSVNLLNVLFLGIFASALCFVTWNFAVRTLGAIKTSVYIYLVPVVTIITSVLILGESLSTMAVAGTALTLLGLFLSEAKFSLRRKTSAL